MKQKTERLIGINREIILKAADELFLTNGIEKTTMDQIAKKAEFSKPTLYGYFKDKDEVFYALVYDFMKKIQAKVVKIQKSKDEFIKKYLMLCNSIYSLAFKYPLYFEGLINNIEVDIFSELTPVVYKEIYSVGEEINAVLIELVQEGKSLNYINKEYKDMEIVLYIWSAVSGVIRMALQKNEYKKMLNLNTNKFMTSCFERVLFGCK